MKWTILTWVAALWLAGCAHQNANQYDQTDFLAGTQEDIWGQPTTIEVYKAGTQNFWVKDNPDCIRGDIVNGVKDILLSTPEWNEYIDNWWEIVDVCLFPNGTHEPWYIVPWKKDNTPTS